jgi:tetratricopeptide (TPR) repeat protein
MRDKDPQAAIQTCAQALNEFPSDTNILFVYGQAFIAIKNLTKALKIADNMLALQSNFAGGHEIKGDIYNIQGNYELAIKSYKKALKLSADSSKLTEKINRAEEFRKDSVNKVNRHTVPFSAELAEAEKLIAANRRPAAERIYRNILTKDPNHSETMRLLAKFSADFNRYDDALMLLERAHQKSVGNLQVLIDLIDILIELGRFNEAIEQSQRLTELAPNKADSFIPLVNAQAKIGDLEGAIITCKKALTINPNHEGIFDSLAHQLKTVGRQDEAIASHRENIKRNPTNSNPYWNLANMKTFRFKDSEVLAMEKLLEKDDLTPLQTAQLNNALGLEFEGRKDYKKAFFHFDACNCAQRNLERYDPVRTEDIASAAIDYFSAERLSSQHIQGCIDTSPIFVVGLPRSGSTLIEQILASHSQVEGTHELSELSRTIDNIGYQGIPQKRLHYPDNLSLVKESGWQAIGQEYIDKTQCYRTGSPYFIDKNPNNFNFIGALKLALPNAKIINARRHPLDSCLGSFKQLFASGQSFSYDIIEIGEYYLQYQRLMDHWHTAMPEFVLDVQYENVTADLESQVRRILDFCNLPFEQNCVDFHQTQRAIKTASSEQVRKPIYKSSVNLWKHYEADLGLLIDILEPLLIHLPIEDQPLLLKSD